MAHRWLWHDFHTHTRPHSPDAHWRASLPAMLRKAKSNGVMTVGLSNHDFPTTNFGLFAKIRQELARKKPKDMSVMVGAELCVLGPTGEIALTAEEASQLDYVLAGPHHFKQRWVEKPPYGDAAAFVRHQQQSLLNAVKHPLVDGLAHPWVINIQHGANRWGFESEAFLAAWTEDLFVELGEAAARHQTAIEIGMGIHFMAQYQGETFWRKYLRGWQIMQACGAKFYFGSDAHHLHVIARIDWLKPTLGQLGFTPDDIVSPQQFGAKSRRASAF
jgi:histidinol phosphatase-like PHP family hydrolase